MGILRRRKERREQQVLIDTEAVLRTMSRFPLHEYTGISLARVVKIDAGRLYIALARLESEGRVTSRWTGTKPPRRRLYQLSDGEKAGI